MREINTVFFRVDANREIGSGHVVRCEIIADNIARKYDSCDIIFLVKTIPTSFETRLKSKGYDIIKLSDSPDRDLQQQVDLLKQHKNAVVIVDSDEPLYYTKEYQLKIKNIVSRLVMITFYSDSHFYADIIHNQNIMAPELSFSCEPYTKKLLGTQYVVLKDRYKELASENPFHSVDIIKKTVMLTFGGSDISNRTSLTYGALQHLSDRISKVIIVLGGMFQHRKELENSIKQSSLDTELYQNTNEMPDLMARCDVALTSGGLTCWEFGALGVLNIILPHSEREKLSASFMHRNNYGYTIEGHQQKGEKKLAETIRDILEDDYSKRVRKLKKAINVHGVDNLIDSII